MQITDQSNNSLSKISSLFPFNFFYLYVSPDKAAILHPKYNPQHPPLPMPIYLAHGLTKRLTELRKSGEIPYLLPDGKSQVTVEYEDDKPSWC